MKRVMPLIVALAALASVSFGQANKDLDKKELAMLKGLEVEQKLAKTKFDKNPKDAKLKKVLIGATMKLADAQLVSPALPPREKYPKALRNYRVVVKLDPKHASAKEKINTIESIYKQMGRPIPPN